MKIWATNCCYIVFPSSAISPSEFTCTSSSSYDSPFTCENIYTDSKNGWITNGTGEGSWVKIEFHRLIRISKIIYRHNEKLPDMCCNQNFKDISLQFSDGTINNVTIDESFNSDLLNSRVENVDYHYRIDPPKLSSHLLLTVNSVYNHTRADTFPYANGGNPLYEKSRFGISSIRFLGRMEVGKVYRRYIHIYKYE